MDPFPINVSVSSPPSTFIYIICSAPLIYFAIYHGTKLLLDAAFLYNRQKKTASPRGCRRLGLPPGQSNIHDEFDPKYRRGVPPDEEEDDDGKPNWRIKALFAYPIKSCAGIEFDVADVVGTGLAYDRLFCFAEYVTPSNNSNSPDGEKAKDFRWEFRTMRNGRFSKLALIRPEIWVPDPSSPSYSPDLEEVKSGGVLVIYYPRAIPSSSSRLSSLAIRLGMALGLCAREASFRVPLHPPPGHQYPSVPVRLWKDFPVAFDYGRHIPAELREFLSPDDDDDDDDAPPPLTLFRADPASYRAIFRCAPRKEQLGFQPHTAFADAYPIHMLNLASVQDVAERCSHAIPRLSVRRFRANIIIQGPEAYAEDAWKRIRVGGGRRRTRKETPDQKTSAEKEDDDDDDGVEIYTSCRTVRCRLPNVDPDTGIRHPTEPDKTLKSFRCIDAGDPKNACLGMQLVPAVESKYITLDPSLCSLFGSRGANMIASG